MFKQSRAAATLPAQDLERAVKELRAKGVKFEEYDTPMLKTVDGSQTWAGRRPRGSRIRKAT